MAFYDIYNLSYERLIAHTKNVKPYRDSGGAYNLGDRRYSLRHFRLRGDLIDIYYARPETSKKIVEKDKTLEPFYLKQHLMTIHPDNSFELMHFSADQGNNMLMSQITRANIFQNGDRKGVMYYNPHTEKMHPMFKGLRIDLKTGNAVTPYKFHKRNIDRKKANELLKEFVFFQDIAMKFIEPMTPEGILEVCKDLYDEVGAVSLIDERLFVKLAKEKRYADAAIAFSIAGTGTHYNSYQYLLQEIYGAGIDSKREEEHILREFNRHYKSILGTRIIECMRDAVLKGCDDAAVLKELPIGERFSASKWGYVITDMNNNKLFRY